MPHFHSASLTGNEQSTANTTQLHKRTGSFGSELKTFHDSLPVKDFDVKASYSNRKAVICLFTVCWPNCLHVCPSAIELMNRCNTKRGKLTVKSFLWQNLSVLADMRLLHIILIRITMSNICCPIFLCISTDSCNLDLLTVSTGKPVSFPSASKNKVLI